MNIIKLLSVVLVSCLILVPSVSTKINADVAGPEFVHEIPSLPITGNAITDSEIECLAKNIYFEARDQPYAGRLAVGLVTLNRVESSKFPNTICGVVYQGKKDSNGKPIRNKCQFSWYCDGKVDKTYNVPIWNRALNTAKNLYTIYMTPDSFAIDITEGAVYYHATYVSPRWKHFVTKTVQIEDHIFYKE